MKQIKKYILLHGLLLAGTFLYAQERPVSAGGEAKGTGGTVSFSVGQVDYINLNTNTVKITQGVQQPAEMLVYPGNNPVIIDRNPEYSLYPNPTRDFTVLHVKQTALTQKISYVLYDMLGRVIAREKLVDVRTTIRVDQLPSAVYILTVVDDSNNKVITQFKIVKIL